MGGSALLYGGIGALTIGLVVMALTLSPWRQERPSVDRAVAAIELQYAREAPADEKSRPMQLPHWFEGLAVLLSPAGIATVMQRRLDVAGNPPGWTTDKMLAVKGLGLVTLG